MFRHTTKLLQNKYLILTGVSGFFYVTNFGLSQESVDKQFAIGKEVFNLSTDEKLKYRAELEKGGYNGYKPLGLRVSDMTTVPGNNQIVANVKLN